MPKAATKVEMWPLSKIKPYAQNAKKHPKEQVERLAALIDRHGFDQPIVVDAKGVIIKGHGRRLAAEHLKLATVPVIMRADLTAAQVREARVADNRVAEFGWDFDALVADVTSAIKLDGFLLDMTGFSEKELGLTVVSEHLRGEVDGSKEISEEELGDGEHECPRCSFRFD